MERIAIEACCLGTQNICKTRENNLVGSVHFLHVHAAVNVAPSGISPHYLPVPPLEPEYSSINYPPAQGRKTAAA